MISAELAPDAHARHFVEYLRQSPDALSRMDTFIRVPTDYDLSIGVFFHQELKDAHTTKDFSCPFLDFLGDNLINTVEKESLGKCRSAERKESCSRESIKCQRFSSAICVSKIQITAEFPGERLEERADVRHSASHFFSSQFSFCYFSFLLFHLKPHVVCNLRPGRFLPHCSPHNLLSNHANMIGL